MTLSVLLCFFFFLKMNFISLTNTLPISLIATSSKQIYKLLVVGLRKKNDRTNQHFTVIGGCSEEVGDLYM